MRGGDYQLTTYQIRYFQPDGKGRLEMDDGTVFLPNDLYPLEKETFRLYYTSASTDQQTIDIYIIDIKRLPLPAQCRLSFWQFWGMLMR